MFKTAMESNSFSVEHYHIWPYLMLLTTADLSNWSMEEKNGKAAVEVKAVLQKNETQNYSTSTVA